MKPLPVLIRQIKQIDNYTFSIQWSDNKEQSFRLSDVQKCCPCANCTDERTGERILDPHLIKESVRAIYVRSVGRYALQIQFTSGCSTGIYSFDMLRRMQEPKS